MRQMRKMDQYFPLMLVLCSCGPLIPNDRPDFYTSAGLEVFHQVPTTYLTHIEAQDIEDFVLTRLYEANALYTEPRIRRCIPGTKAVVMTLDQDFLCSSPGHEHCSGEEYGQTLLLASVGACGYDSALAHELGHWLQWCIEQKIDYYHKDILFWAYLNQSIKPCTFTYTE